MCHVINVVTANHRLSSRTVHILPVLQFAVCSSLNTHTHAWELSFLVVSSLSDHSNVLLFSGH